MCIVVRLLDGGFSFWKGIKVDLKVTCDFSANNEICLYHTLYSQILYIASPKQALRFNSNPQTKVKHPRNN